MLIRKRYNKVRFQTLWCNDTCHFVEPLESVINDLKSLTAAIIEETSMTET